MHQIQVCILGLRSFSPLNESALSQFLINVVFYIFYSFSPLCCECGCGDKHFHSTSGVGLFLGMKCFNKTTNPITVNEGKIYCSLNVLVFINLYKNLDSFLDISENNNN